MAIAEYDVVIQRDAMSVYDFLLDARNLPSWRAGVRSIELESGAAGTKGAVYRQTIAGPGGRTRLRGLRDHRGAARGGDPVPGPGRAGTARTAATT